MNVKDVNSVKEAGEAAVDSGHPIFVVGVGRSGTTLVRSTLNAHPRLVIPPESHFISRWQSRNPSLDLDDREIFDRFWAAFVQDEHFKRFELDTEALAERLWQNRPVTYQKIFLAVMETYAERSGRPRWGEKTPGHDLHLDTIFRWHPHAQVIFMVRDPRAVCASLKKTPWGSHLTHLNAWRWNKSMAALAKWRDDERVFALHYEQLVREPEPTLRRICEFIREPFADSMLHRSQEALPVTTDRTWSVEHLKSTLRPIDASSLHKWRSQLSDFEARLIEHLCGRQMRLQGYALEMAGLTFGQRVLWFLIRLNEVIKFVARLMPAPFLDRLRRLRKRLFSGRRNT